MRRSTKVVVGLTSVALIAGAACKPGAPDPAFGDHGTVAVAGVTGERRLYPTADGGTLVGGPIPLVALGPDGVRHDDLDLGLPPGCIGWDTLERDGDGFVGLCRGAAGPLGVARTSAAGTPDLAFGDDGVAPPPVEMPRPQDVVALPAGGYALAGVGPGEGTRASAPPVVVAVLDDAGDVAAVASATPRVQPIPPEIDATPYASGARVQATDSGAAVLASVGTTVVNVPFGTTAVSRLDADGDVVDGLHAPGFDLRRDDWTGVVDLDAGRWAVAATATTFDFEGHRQSTVGTVTIRLPDGSVDPAAPTISPALPDGRLILPRAVLSTAGGTRLWVAGAVAGSPTAVVARYDAASGALDPAFGTGGIVTLPMASVSDMAVSVDGRARVYVAGTDAGGDVVVTRLFGHTSPPAPAS